MSVNAKLRLPHSCDVHTFDPSISHNARPRLSDYCRKGDEQCCEMHRRGQHSEHVRFHKIGLTGKNADHNPGVSMLSMLTGQQQLRKVRTLRSLMHH